MAFLECVSGEGGSESMNEQADCKLGVWDGWAGRCLWRGGLTVVHQPELDPLSDRGKHVTHLPFWDVQGRGASVGAADGLDRETSEEGTP